MTQQFPPGPGHATLLVVDDDAAALRMLTELLRLAGYQVRPFERAELALAAAVEMPPDLALLDVRMPVMDGIELCRRLKSDPRTAAMPVIFVSGVGDADVAVQGFDAGAVDFVQVPIQERVLLARVGTHLNLAWMRQRLEAERATLEQRVRERTEQLQESEYVARSLFEQAAVGMAHVGLDGRFLRVNRTFCQIVGYPESDLLTRDVEGLVHPDDRPDASIILRRLAYGDVQTDTREERYVRTDGASRWTQRTVTLIRPEGQRQRWLVMVAHDIEARKQAEQAVLDYQRRLRRLTAELARTEARERRNIAAELHDHVGQSLSAMRALLAAARRDAAGGAVDGPLEELSDYLRDAIRATRSIMSNLSSPTLNELGLSAALSEWLREQIGNRHRIDVRFHDDGAPKPLGADESGTVFMSARELVTNVVKHARASRVSVELRRRDDRLEIVVEDDGVGMPPGCHRRGKPGEGGFGLFSVEERIADLGGMLTIENRSAGGVRARLTVPLARQVPALGREALQS